MHIDIVSDTICPWCYIGKRRLERALAQRPDVAVEIGWRPFQLNPDMPRAGMERQAYLDAKFGGHSADVYRRVADAAAAERLALAFDRIERTPNTLDSHRLIRWAGEAGVQNHVVERLFAGYFSAGEDIGDAAVLTEVAVGVGMDAAKVAEDLAGERDRALVQAEDRMARDLGVEGVPAFIIERRYLISGAQDPAVFLQAFDLAAREAAGASATATG